MATKTKSRIRAAKPNSVAAAANALRAGRLVAFPTETVYGLGADATNGGAVANIFAAKSRPKFNPLIVHVDDIETARKYVAFDSLSEKLAEEFWPGSLTLILPRRPNCPISLLASAGRETLAIRVPDDPVAFTLLTMVERPIAAPSANRSGSVSPTTAQHVAEDLGDAVAFVLDGGPCSVGIESTVVDVSRGRPTVLRHGAIPAEDLVPITGPLSEVGQRGAAPASPGMQNNHYAPRRPLRIEADSLREGEALLAFGAHELGNAAAELNLSESGDLVEAAANLFAMIRELDQPKYKGIAVMPIPEEGLGLAINDRLRRAAH